MTEYQLAVITLSLIYILCSPLIVMMVFNMGGTNRGFLKDYSAAFIGWHAIGLTIGATVGVVHLFWWSIGVLFIK